MIFHVIPSRISISIIYIFIKRCNYYHFKETKKHHETTKNNKKNKSKQTKTKKTNNLMLYNIYIFNILNKSNHHKGNVYISIFYSRNTRSLPSLPPPIVLEMTTISTTESSTTLRPTGSRETISKPTRSRGTTSRPTGSRETTLRPAYLDYIDYEFRVPDPN